MRIGLWSYDHVHAPAYLRVLTHRAACSSWA